MATAARKQIIEALDELPGEGLAMVAEFVEHLRAMALARPAEPPERRVVSLGGLWQGYTFSEQETSPFKVIERTRCRLRSQ